MLQKVRDNMKGTFVAVVVFLLFIVPLVLTGVGDGSFLGSAVGTDAASVEGKDISNAELRRAIFMQKQRLLGQQGVDPNAEFLKDENLRGPVLDNLTRRAALVVSAEKGGMGVSNDTLDKQIREQPEFQVDGVFDLQTYRRLLANLAYTPASYKAILSEDTLVTQHAEGIALSAFSTDLELANMVSLTQQKRSFFTIKIPVDTVKEEVLIEDEEITQYYEANKQKFIEEEKLTAQYIELSVSNIALSVEVNEEDVKSQYEQELAEFQDSQEYEIAHLLIEEKDNQKTLVEEVAQKIKSDEDFSELVRQYSDDSGSKDSGGNLGVLTPGIFPEAFEQAVYGLEQDQISGPVETEAGIHFIKVLAKIVAEPPTFEDRKQSIESALKQAQAEEIYGENFDRLGELTFSAADLKDAAEELDLTIKTTATFTRGSGTGIASSQAFRDAAFSEEVLTNSYNSGVIELSNRQAVVLRKGVHSPERTKKIEEVKEPIVTTLTDEKIDKALNAFVEEVKEKLTEVTDSEQVATALEYEYKMHDKVGRSSGNADFQVISKAFSMSLGDQQHVYESMVDRDGNHIVIGLTEIIAGKQEDIQEQQLKGLTAQLNIQSANFETASYEDLVVEEADIDIY